MYKDSVQDAVSEFFYSCSGSQYNRGSKIDRDHKSGYSQRRTPRKSDDRFGASEKSYNRMSDAGSDKRSRLNESL